MKRKIPEPTLDQYLKAFTEQVLLIPAKEGYIIYIYPDGKHYKYVKEVALIAEKGLTEMSLN